MLETVSYSYRQKRIIRNLDHFWTAVLEFKINEKYVIDRKREKICFFLFICLFAILRSERLLSCKLLVAAADVGSQSVVRWCMWWVFCVVLRCGWRAWIASCLHKQLMNELERLCHVARRTASPPMTFANGCARSWSVCGRPKMFDASIVFSYYVCRVSISWSDRSSPFLYYLHNLTRPSFFPPFFYTHQRTVQWHWITHGTCQC